MSTPRIALIVLAAAAVSLAASGGFSDGSPRTSGVISPSEREAYEEANFNTPEGKLAAELAQLSAGTHPESPAVPDVNDALLHPKEWPVLAKGKLCEYTATLMGNADRDGTAVPETARGAAKRILDRC